ncbi:hypothetical protein KY290_036512 [Solanum tuberosum]|uniref:Uncharacterized protein n=1 Tax=Solanum tuberosum TaxID=4113 RepID=A0ABQ7TUI3_SOLTU|nr:hypothetical protein KY290_036512 [Solanum tuberosum]
MVRKFQPRDSSDDVQENDNDFEDLHDSIDRKRKRTHTVLRDDMNPSIFKKSEMGSSSKNVKQSFLSPGTLARGRGQSLILMGSKRISNITLHMGAMLKEVL